MKIFIPAKKDKNPFLDEIEIYSSNEYEFSHFSKYSESFEIVNIHWPEALFDWKELTEQDLKKIEEEIRRWKKKSVLVYTRHDAKPHKKRSPTILKLFKLVEENADGFIHLGEYSRKEMSLKYPNAKHIVIPHHLYLNSYEKLNKEIARKKLNIGQNDFVVVCPGRIRKLEERNMILAGFNKIPLKNKVLLCSQMVTFGLPLQFKGSTFIKKKLKLDHFNRFLFEYKYKPPSYRFNYGFSSREDLSLMLSASDVVLIPRIDNLNSGILFLGLTFQKMVVGPEIGNIKEYLKLFRLPSFKPVLKGSLKNALMQAYSKTKDENFLDNELVKQYHPQIISSRIDEFFKRLSNS